METTRNKDYKPLCNVNDIAYTIKGGESPAVHKLYVMAVYNDDMTLFHYGCPVYQFGWKNDKGRLFQIVGTYKQYQFGKFLFLSETEAKQALQNIIKGG